MSNAKRYIEAANEAAQLLTKIEKAATRRRVILAGKIYQYDENERVQTINDANAALEALEYVAGRIKSIRRTMLNTNVMDG